jgi:hypothetical protein
MAHSCSWRSVSATLPEPALSVRRNPASLEAMCVFFLPLFGKFVDSASSAECGLGFNKLGSASPSAGGILQQPFAFNAHRYRATPTPPLTHSPLFWHG